MAFSRNIRFVLGALGVSVALAAFTAWLFWSRVDRYVAGVHQRSVTRSLRDWGHEYAAVTNDEGALAAAEMVGYMSHYYVPGPGYRGPPEIEAALENQRSESIRRVVDALQQYTKLDFGTNVQRWTQWAELGKQDRSAARNSEPDGAVTQGQPIRPETNRTSAAAAPGR